MPTRDCLSAALRYARRGWAVFPLDGKRPYPGTNGHSEATTDRRQIKRWWKRWPDANVGIACDSQRGPIVIDIDGGNGQVLADKLKLPYTREASSQNPGRRHLYFSPMIDGTEIPRKIKVKYKNMKYDFDILGDGGYVVAPPSIHPETGKRYVWRNQSHLEPLPVAVLRLLRDTSTRRAADPLPPVIGEGERNTLLTSLAGTMRRRGAPQEAILAALEVTNQTMVSEPLSDRELRVIAGSIAKKAPAPIKENLTDLGNARRFVHRHREDVKSSGGKRGWWLWDGTRWARDESGEVMRYAKATVRSLSEEAERLEGSDRDDMLKHAFRSEQANRVQAVIQLAAGEPEIFVDRDAFDAKPWLFNVENGTLDLRTGSLLEHSRDHLLTKLAPVEFDPVAACPRWERFLLDIMDGDLELVDFIQRAVGYAMTGETREHCLFFLYGQGANGKSTLLEVLRALFGDYAQQSDFSTFLARKSEGPRNDLARMRGSRFVTAVETDGERGFDSAVVRTLTGGDTIVARRLFEEFTEFTPQHKIFLAANNKPIVKEHSEGFWRRIRIIPFTVTFTAARRDKTLIKKLQKELPGILNWALVGCKKWQETGLTIPKAIRRATEEYREDNDPVGEFIEQRIVKDPSCWMSTTELHKQYTEWWTETRGEKAFGGTLAWLSRQLAARPEIKPRKKHGVRGWQGYTIRQELT